MSRRYRWKRDLAGDLPPGVERDRCYTVEHFRDEEGVRIHVLARLGLGLLILSATLHLPRTSRFVTNFDVVSGTACSGASCPTFASAQPDTGDPARIAIYGPGDSIIGYLVLGRSTPPDAQRLLEAQGGLGPARDNQVTFRVGSATLRPPLLYTPPGTLHQLYFQKDTLVLVVAGMPHGLPSTRLEFMSRFPRAQETHRESGWYELQTPLSDCVWLIAVFTTTTDRLESNGYASTCSG